MIRRDLESVARDMAKKMEESSAREVVMSLARNDILLQGGHYLTEDELQKQRDFMRNYRFQYLPE